jgi:hypothetical protein
VGLSVKRCEPTPTPPQRGFKALLSLISVNLIFL